MENGDYWVQKDFDHVRDIDVIIKEIVHDDNNGVDALLRDLGIP